MNDLGMNNLKINNLQQHLSQIKFYSIISADGVLEYEFMIKKKDVLAIHKFSITAPCETSTRVRWMTYIDVLDKRTKITASTEALLFEKLFEHYFPKQELCLLGLLPEWLERRKNENISFKTIERNKNHWDKYYLHHDIVRIPLRKLSTDDIELFLHDCIKKYSMTRKELNNMKFILQNMLKLAMRKKLILLNPLTDADINTFSCKPPKNLQSKDRIYLSNDKVKFFDALNDELKFHPENTDVYGIFILFKLGLRIGELAALRFSDIDYESKTIHIHSMETSVEEL